MTPTDRPTDTELVRHFRATPEALFAAWTDPDKLSLWYCPNPDLAVGFDGTVAPGEAYTLTMGEAYTVRGHYLVVDEPRVLEFTWQWDGGEPSVVRVEIDSTEDGTTRLRLTHRDLPSEADATGHGEGWDLSLNRLVLLLAG